MPSIAIVQSNYIPWKGYFDLIGKVDRFVLYDTVQYTARDWRNRNRIKTKDGVKWLTVPVVHRSQTQRICETKVAHHEWTRTHWQTIARNYARAAHFKTYGPRIEELYHEAKQAYLSDVNHHFITALCKMLDIHTPVTQLKGAPPKQERNKALIDLCKLHKADTYLSGPSAKAYLNEAMFKKNGIRVRWMEYDEYKVYPQLFPPFEHTVSLIDLLLNTGIDARRYVVT